MRGDDRPREYRSDDRELLMGLYQRLIVRWLVPRVPDWVAPNAITVVGQICMTLGVVATWGAKSGPRWLFLVAPLLFVAYVVADNVDGQHARRTGRNSPVGELLDHGLDGLASGCMLLSFLMLVELDRISGTALVTVGAFAYFLVLWEQYRTGLLVIPAMSGTEAVTILTGAHLLAFAFDDPGWLHLQADGLNLSTVLLVVAFVLYVVALVPPLVRVRRQGTSPVEVLPVLAVLVAMSFYTVAGASPLAVGAADALLAADLSCRMILLRRGSIRGRALTAARALVLLPLVPALLAPDLLPGAAWAGLAVGLAGASFARTLVGGIVTLTREAGTALDPQQA